jgi:hypothetical protein
LGLRVVVVVATKYFAHGRKSKLVVFDSFGDFELSV